MSSSVACHLTHLPETLNAGLDRRNAHSSRELARCALRRRSLAARSSGAWGCLTRCATAASRSASSRRSTVRSDLSVKRTFEEIYEGARLGGRRAASRKHRP
jgi:hypothetical protein